MSTRIEQTRRERIAFEQEFNKKQRESEDRPEYEKYAKQHRDNGIQPLSFEQWQKNVPDDFQDAPAALRGAIASSRSTWNGAVGNVRDMVANEVLSSDMLEEFGFDPTNRVNNADVELSPFVIRAGFEQFSKDEPEYNFKAHFDAMVEFLVRNKLFPSVQHLSLTFHLLRNMGLLPEPEPGPAPQPLKVKLEIEPDPEVQRQRRIRDYEETVVLRYDGKDWTQKMLDEADSDTYARVTRLKRISGWHTPSLNA